jgi:hypothetical protein
VIVIIINKGQIVADKNWTIDNGKQRAGNRSRVITKSKSKPLLMPHLKSYKTHTTFSWELIF